MSDSKPKAAILLLISGILNCLLAVAHQVVLYMSYSDYSKVITTDTEPVLADFLLFSMGIGTTVLIVGLLTIYCYIGLKRGEKWPYIVGVGFSLLLLSFAVKIVIVLGFDQPVAYIHLLNSLLIGVPLLVNRKAAV